MSFSKKRVSILGVTGSVGRAAMDVIRSHPERFDVQCVTAGQNAQALADAAVVLGAKKAVIADMAQYADLKESLEGTGIEVEASAQAIENAAALPCDLVLAAIVGLAGLRPILRALEAGVNVAIANKEPLVAAGWLVREVAAKSGAKIIPVDSEHNAIFQVFEDHNRDAIEKIILTASGGPFRTWTREQMETATPEQALKHPNWSMGPKISVDSATMMNKALEVIEAYYLFDLRPEKIEVVLHPQSIVHSMVAYADGSVLAQMGPSDMRVPIAYALAWPERMTIEGAHLDFTKSQNLSFEPVDFVNFPAIGYAYTCLRSGPSSCIAMNGANEVAVQAFLDHRIGFMDILRCIEAVFETNGENIPKTVEDIERYDTIARQNTNAFIHDLKN